jgi:hypothetical protein
VSVENPTERAGDGRLIAHDLYNGGYGCVLPDQRFVECASWGQVQEIAERMSLTIAMGAFITKGRVVKIPRS